MRFGDLTQGSAKPPPGCLSDLPRSGLRTQPGVLTPGTHPTRRVALIRRYIGAPIWKNTRVSGLSVLKGRKVKFVITSGCRLVRHTTRSSVMDFRARQSTILFDVIASSALSGRSLNGVIPGVKTPGVVLKPLHGKSDRLLGYPESQLRRSRAIGVLGVLGAVDVLR